MSRLCLGPASLSHKHCTHALAFPEPRVDQGVGSNRAEYAKAEVRAPPLGTVAGAGALTLLGAGWASGRWGEAYMDEGE